MYLRDRIEEPKASPVQQNTPETKADKGQKFLFSPNRARHLLTDILMMLKRAIKSTTRISTKHIIVRVTVFHN
jgi:hypothetical protein